MIGDPYLLLADLAGSGIFRAWTFMLLHSLWLGLLLHMAAVFLLRYSKRMSAAVIYKLLLFLFFIFLVACGCILVLQLRTAPTGLMVGSPLTSVAVSAFSWWPLLTWAWLIVFLIRSCRFGWDLTSNYQLARSARSETNPSWQHRLDQLAALLGISGRVRLLESSSIYVPVIIGVLKPVILVPLGVLASMPADQLEAVLLHELAHIRRKDYLVNLIQVIAEAIFFFNPGLRWISAQLRIHREHCCDDIALGHVDKLTFVQALVSFQEHFLYRRAFPLAFTGQKDRLL
ncbi:MAG: M56 family metallopeptidase, partial [Chitinophagaceae bacterium]